MRKLVAAVGAVIVLLLVLLAVDLAPVVSQWRREAKLKSIATPGALWSTVEPQLEEVGFEVHPMGKDAYLLTNPVRISRTQSAMVRIGIATNSPRLVMFGPSPGAMWFVYCDTAGAVTRFQPGGF
jgi:hypothetical protein